MNDIKFAADREEYSSAARRVVEGESSVEAESLECAVNLIEEVMSHDGTAKSRDAVNELRGGLAWANALDREASTESGAVLSDEEIIARRIMHHAGRMALDNVKTENRRIQWRVRRAESIAAARLQVMADGAGQIQALSRQNLVQCMMKARK